MLPEIGRIDATLFNMSEQGLHAINIMDRKKTGDTRLPCHGRNLAGHIAVAMDKIRPHTGNDIIDDLPLKSKCDLHVFSPLIGVNPIHVEKSHVFSQLDPIVRHYPSDGFDVLFNNRRQVIIEHGALIR
jgi:hypothetical protein